MNTYCLPLLVPQGFIHSYVEKKSRAEIAVRRRRRSTLNSITPPLPEAEKLAVATSVDWKRCDIDARSAMPPTMRHVERWRADDDDAPWYSTMFRQPGMMRVTSDG
jgi:hypothetical protein